MVLSPTLKDQVGPIRVGSSNWKPELILKTWHWIKKYKMARHRELFSWKSTVRPLSKMRARQVSKGAIFSLHFFQAGSRQQPWQQNWQAVLESRPRLWETFVHYLWKTFIASEPSYIYSCARTNSLQNSDSWKFRFSSRFKSFAFSLLFLDSELSSCQLGDTPHTELLWSENWNC